MRMASRYEIDKIDEMEPNNVMIIIFWATFCARIEKIRKSFDEHGAVVSKVHSILLGNALLWIVWNQNKILC